MKSMSEVLAGHYIDITETNPDNIDRCVCGHSADSMNIGWDDHLAEALTAAGFGPVAKLTAEVAYQKARAAYFKYAPESENDPEGVRALADEVLRLAGLPDKLRETL